MVACRSTDPKEPSARAACKLDVIRRSDEVLPAVEDGEEPSANAFILRGGSNSYARVGP